MGEWGCSRSFLGGSNATYQVKARSDLLADGAGHIAPAVGHRDLEPLEAPRGSQPCQAARRSGCSPGGGAAAAEAAPIRQRCARLALSRGRNLGAERTAAARTRC